MITADGDGDERDLCRDLPERGVGDVTAIQLAERQQVERGRQHAEPRRPHHRMKVDDRCPLGSGRTSSQRTARKSGGLPSSRSVSAGGDTVSSDMYIPRMSAGTSTTNPAIGPANADVEQDLALRKRLADADDRAEGADLQPARSQIRAAGSRAASRRAGTSGRPGSGPSRARRESRGSWRCTTIREGVRSSPGDRPARGRSPPGMQVPVLADQRGRDERDEEERDVLPPDVLEAAARFGRKRERRFRIRQPRPDHVGWEHRIDARDRQPGRRVVRQNADVRRAISRRCSGGPCRA